MQPTRCLLKWFQCPVNTIAIYAAHEWTLTLAPGLPGLPFGPCSPFIPLGPRTPASPEPPGAPAPPCMKLIIQLHITAYV